MTHRAAEQSSEHKLSVQDAGLQAVDQALTGIAHPGARDRKARLHGGI